MKIRGVEVLAAGLLAVTFAACSGAAPSAHIATQATTGTTASGIPATADVASFGIPATINGWRLVATIKTIYPETAAIIAAAGGNPSTAIDVDVQVYGSARLNFDVLRVPGVSFDAFMRAAEPYLAMVGVDGTVGGRHRRAGRSALCEAGRCLRSAQHRLLHTAWRPDLRHWLHDRHRARDARLRTALGPITPEDTHPGPASPDTDRHHRRAVASVSIELRYRTGFGGKMESAEIRSGRRRNHNRVGRLLAVLFIATSLAACTTRVATPGPQAKPTPSAAQTGTPEAMPTPTSPTAPAPTASPALTPGFSATGSMTTGRKGRTATLLVDGRVLLAGGYDHSQRLASAELYEPEDGLVQCDRLDGYRS